MVKWGFVLAGATASAVTSLAMVSGSFDALLTKIQVSTDATTDQMSKIKDAIIDVSIASGRWPSEVANAFDAMANAGLNADEAYKALRETMGQVALATGEDMISSGQAITKVMKAMNLDIADFNRVAAVMTVLGNNTGKSIAELAGQMSTIAPVAEMAGVSLEQLAAMTEVLSKSGRGGGQELRRMLLGLIDPSLTAREAFKQLNVEIVKNDKGQLDLIATLKALKERMGDVNQYSTQMKALFSNLGISFAKVLLDEINVVLENSVEKYGSAEEKLKSMADTMATTLPAALDRSKAALSALGIQLGEPFKKPVTDLLNSFADIVVKIREWTEKNPELAMTLAKVAAGISAILIGIPTLIAGILSLVGAFLKLKEIMIAMEAALPGLNAGLATLALRLAAVTAAAWGLYQIKQFFDELDEWGKSLDTMEASLENETKLMEMSSKKVADFNQQTGESAKTLQQVVQLINQKGYRLDQATGKWAINTEAVKAAEAAAKKNADAQKVTGDQLDRQRELLMKVRPLVVENMRDSIAKLEAQKKLALAQASASGEFKDPAAEAAYKAAIAAKYDREIFDYRKKLAIQSASDLLSMGKIDSKMAMEINDFEYDHRLINVEEYIKKKQELELADYNNELSLLRSKLAEGGYGEAEKAQLEGQLAIKEKERQLLLDQQKREATDLREQATMEANDLQIELLNIEKSGIDERDAERVRAVERNIERAKREAALLKLIASGVQKGSAEYIKAENDLRQQEKLNDTKYLETKAKNRLDTKAQLLQMEVNSLADYGKMGDERLMLLQRQHDVELEQSKQSWLDQGKTREEINQLTNQKILEQAIEYNSMEEQVLQSKLDVASRITGGMANCLESYTKLVAAGMKRSSG
jgi:TP901 family phage tail tape measure protein